MNINVTVPEGTAIDLQAELYRVASEKSASGRRQAELAQQQLKQARISVEAAQEKIKAARALWIDGTLELAVVVAEARMDYPDHQAFSRWLSRHGLEHMHPNDCMALKGFSRDLQAARKMLEESRSFSWRGIWEKPQKGANAALTKNTNLGRGRISTARSQHDASGSSKRKRKREPVIPTCMRDDYVPGEIAKRAAERPAEPKRRRRSGLIADRTPPTERPIPKLRTLTREQVDPDFKGDAHEFTRKYGLVNLQTKQEIEHHQQQELLMAWLGPVSDHAKTARLLLAAIAVDPAVLREWMAKPAKAEKLQAWCNSIEQACESIRKIIARAPA